jgi:hypothetical protein
VLDQHLLLQVHQLLTQAVVVVVRLAVHLVGQEAVVGAVQEELAVLELQVLQTPEAVVVVVAAVHQAQAVQAS